MKYRVDMTVKEISNHFYIGGYNLDIHNFFIDFIEHDSRNIVEGEDYKYTWFICLEGKNFDSHSIIGDLQKKGIKNFIYNPQKTDLRPPGICVNDTVAFMGELSSLHRKKRNTPILAITGSNGKTSTKELSTFLLTHYLQPNRNDVVKNEASFNNEFGVPFTLFKLNKETSFGVIEIGTNHKGEIKNLSDLVAPNYAIITTIQGGHIGNFGSLLDIAHEKYDIGSGIADGGHLFVHDSIAYSEVLKSRNYPFSIHWVSDANSSLRLYKSSIAGTSFWYKDHLYALLLPGIHQFYNLQLIVAFLEQATIDYPHLFNGVLSDVLWSLISFSNIDGRLRKHPNSTEQYTLWDDTYNANQASFEAAIHTLSNSIEQSKLYGIFGQINELGEHEVKIHQEVATLAAQKLEAVAFLSNSISLQNIFLEAWCLTNKKENILVASLSDEDIEKATLFIKDKSKNKQISILFKGSRSGKIERSFSYFT